MKKIKLLSAERIGNDLKLIYGKNFSG